jgi:SAM-dependent methyltransferase
MYCKGCGNNIKEPFLLLGNSPLSNAFIKEKDLYKKEEYYPLNVYVCENCRLVQIEDVIPNIDIFNSDYIYYSSYSTSWIEHCKNYVDMIVKKLNLNYKSKIVEIGCNDGCLLENFKKYNIMPLGVEPSTETANIAISKGIDVDKCFFNYNYVKKKIGNTIIDLIIGNNVFAHNPNPNEFIRSMRYILKQDGVITLEFPYLLNLIKYNQFDTIYHEHFLYLSLYTANKLITHNGLKIFDVEEIPTHGGSIRIYVTHSDNDIVIQDSVKLLLNNEIELNDISTYYKFTNKIIKLKKDILEFIISLTKRDKKIICYGAPAKGNTLLNYCGIGKEFINYTVDLSPHKQYKYLPGTHIPVYHPDKIKEDKPDYIIILPWNIKDEIIKQLEYTKEWNCKLVTLIPEIKIYD